MRLRFTLAYDGSRFSGWQSQSHGQAVQDAVEGAFRALCGGRVVVHGAGRTDAGVHAAGQCAHADVPDDRLPAAAWLPALNAHLPEGVRIMTLRRTKENFHARFSAKGKIYRYTVWSGPVMPPLLLGRAWHVPQALDMAALREACAAFAGRHDFAAFSARRPRRAGETTRTISSVRVRKIGPLITLTFQGEGFLYKMVRMLAASAIRRAAGRLPPGEIPRLLMEGGPRTNQVAPAGGLCLVRVLYS
ncbi:MAG: tRNA pseudouridine(38-40) synthase TruA [Verrucomicrobiae bacterium]